MIKKKIKLYSIENRDDFNYYVFDKEQEVVESLSKIFDGFGVELYLREEYKTKGGKWKSRKIDFGKYYDVCENFVSYKYQNFEGKIFYGKERIFVIVHCSQKLRLKFNEELDKISIMPKPKKCKPIEK